MDDLFPESFKRLSTELFGQFSQYQQMLDMDYKTIFWEKSISLNDVRTGLPSIFAFHNLERENKDIVKVTGKILNLRYTIEVRFLPPGFDMHIRFTMNSVDINNPNEFDINDETLLDIVNAYHIRMNRLKCVRLDATYAPRRH